jgi:hypothetical protein
MELPALFENVADNDYLGFGAGSHFDPKRVSDVLDLRDAEVSKITSTPMSKIRYDKLPPEVREHLEQIATTCNLVAGVFHGDVNKTVLWFKTKNPLLGDVSPRDMVRLGRFDRLRRFIISSMAERSSQRSLTAS